jgi:hypothetical protein
MGVKDLGQGMILARTPRDRERWSVVQLLAQGWTAEALERGPHTMDGRRRPLAMEDLRP